MFAGFDLDVDVRCTSCGADRELPQPAARVLAGDDLYADTTDPCECGAKRVRVEVKIDDGSEAQHPRSGSPPGERR